MRLCFRTAVSSYVPDISLWPLNNVPEHGETRDLVLPYDPAPLRPAVSAAAIVASGLQSRKWNVFCTVHALSLSSLRCAQHAVMSMKTRTQQSAFNHSSKVIAVGLSCHRQQLTINPAACALCGH